MGVRARVFFVDDQGKLVRFSYARFERLWHYDPIESIHESSARFALFAVAYVELVERKPHRLLQVDYSRIELDDEGRFDQEAIQRSLVVAAASVERSWLHSAGEERGNIIRAEYRFHRARYKSEFNWEPSIEQREEIHRLAFL